MSAREKVLCLFLAAAVGITFYGCTNGKQESAPEAPRKPVVEKPKPESLVKPVLEKQEGEIIADDEGPDFKIISGKWGSANDTVRGSYATINHWAVPGKERAEARWTLAVPASGDYEVFARWSQAANRATNTPYTIQHAGGVDTVRVNQQENGGKWNSLGAYKFSKDKPASIIITDDADNVVIADAVKLVPKK